ncbi:hypothetical protein [Rhizobium altiplani]|uniref:hypothetical protein n=1 Tax=Rhizobium altiplani TaxID=1864509 RepID=UPI001041D955|nr:hypothetical protein [Rhizobium altiplani]
MSLVNLSPLNDNEVELLTTVVTAWCEKHHIEPDSECGQAVMVAALRLLTDGEKNPTVLNEAITVAMHVQLHKKPHLL